MPKNYPFIKFLIYLITAVSSLLVNSCLTPINNKTNNITIVSTSVSTAKKPANFIQAKKLAKDIHAKHNITFYCGCVYNVRTNQVDLHSCGYKVQHNNKRAHRIEWEHIVPASDFGKNRSCWTNKLCCNKNNQCFKGRNCCQKIDPDFAAIEADLHNIVPVIGEINLLRSNYSFSELPNIKFNQFGACKIKIDKTKNLVEPRPEIKGIIARAYLYMANLYKITLSKEQNKLFLKWNRKYPPSIWEIIWNEQVTKVQGNDNPYISNYDKYY